MNGNRDVTEGMKKGHVDPAMRKKERKEQERQCKQKGEERCQGLKTPHRHHRHKLKRLRRPNVKKNEFIN